MIILSQKTGNIFRIVMTETELKIWRAGIKHGLWMYAVWRNGREYVGSSGKNLKNAIAEIDAGKEDKNFPGAKEEDR